MILALATLTMEYSQCLNRYRHKCNLFGFSETIVRCLMTNKNGLCGGEEF